MGDSACATEVCLRRIEEHIASMPSLSVTATRVLEICNNPRASATELNRVIELDPILMGQVLRVVNSAFYGRGTTVTTLPRAIIMLGVNTVKNLVLSLAILKVLRTEGSYKTFTMEQFWLHSLCTGVAARLLAAARGLPGEVCWDCFVGGLLHDLGKIPLNDLFAGEYARILADAAGSGEPLYTAELAAFGLDHMQVGGMIARKWGLGDMLADCLAHHHFPDRAAAANVGRADVVGMADVCANHLGIGYAGGTPLSAAEVGVMFSERGLAADGLASLGEALAAEIDSAKAFLQLSNTGGQP